MLHRRDGLRLFGHSQASGFPISVISSSFMRFTGFWLAMAAQTEKRFFL
jgi:hypothetical protein